MRREARWIRPEAEALVSEEPHAVKTSEALTSLDLIFLLLDHTCNGFGCEPDATATVVSGIA